ncbi:Uncharacterized protein LW94_543 [Fusarium fujikuroi]|nr:Uncharacterized protein Y057_13537 [Fusarium fujikuroi]KLP20247.1 Uncharacterized protein LW94_543 [Fusarium fujikuroi]
MEYSFILRLTKTKQNLLGARQIDRQQTVLSSLTTRYSKYVRRLREAWCEGCLITRSVYMPPESVQGSQKLEDKLEDISNISFAHSILYQEQTELIPKSSELLCLRMRVSRFLLDHGRVLDPWAIYLMFIVKLCCWKFTTQKRYMMHKEITSGLIGGRLLHLYINPPSYISRVRVHLAVWAKDLVLIESLVCENIPSAMVLEFMHVPDRNLIVCG